MSSEAPPSQPADDLPLAYGQEQQQQPYDEFDDDEFVDENTIKAGAENLDDEQNPIQNDLELKKKIVLYYHELVSLVSE